MDIKNTLKIVGIYAGVAIAYILAVDFFAGYFLGKFDYCMVKMFFSMILGCFALHPLSRWIIGKIL